MAGGMLRHGFGGANHHDLSILYRPDDAKNIVQDWGEDIREYLLVKD
jgi:hypothetical protein